jgi:hypothetical protein
MVLKQGAQSQIFALYRCNELNAAQSRMEIIIHKFVS